MTRTYARETVTYTQADIDALVDAGRAEYFAGMPGYVIDKKVAVRTHQILDRAPVSFIPQDDVAANVAVALGDDDNAAEAALAAVELRESSIQDYIELAAAQGISVEEYTDGEYYVNNGRVFSAEDRARYAAKSTVFQRFDAILADFGI